MVGHASGGSLDSCRPAPASRSRLLSRLLQVVFVVNTSSEVTRLSAVGNCPQLGSWGLEGSVLLTYDEATGEAARLAAQQQP